MFTTSVGHCALLLVFFTKQIASSRQACQRKNGYLKRIRAWREATRAVTPAETGNGSCSHRNAMAGRYGVVVFARSVGFHYSGHTGHFRGLFAMAHLLQALHQ
jgi:hypothetical protein